MSASKPDIPSTDPIAAALWAARSGAHPVDPLPRLSLRRGHEIADLLYGQLRQEGARQVGWKIAATDPAVQRRFGTDAPFAAPVYDATIVAGGSRLSLGSFVAPVLEAEIGVGLVGGLATVLPCIEIADCRVRGWNVRLPEAVADFGLQGAMVFGSLRKVAAAGSTEVVVTREGEVVARGSADLQSAIERARKVCEMSGSAFAPGTAIVIATGSVLSPLPLAVGRWTVAFGALGSLSLEIVP